VARYCQAADVYLHLARADTFPTTVIEALACGTPVVATAVGGIREQICNLPGVLTATDADDVPDATGVLTPPGDAEFAAAAVMALGANRAIRGALGRNAVRDARARFDVQRQIACYLEWYGAIIESRTRHAV
jgi:glycosyltransferase involved in cell wall biosynthesis